MMIHYKHTTPLLVLFLHAVSLCAAREPIDLSLPDYERSDSYNAPEFSNLWNLASKEEDVNAMIALKHGEMVAEYYDTDFSPSQKFELWSGTKAWMSLLFGIMEQEGLIDIKETLWDIFPDPSIWENVEDAHDRKNVTVEHLLQMRAGLEMPKGWVANDVLTFARGRLGGKDFADSLTYHTLDPAMVGRRQYMEAANIMSYIILERTGMSPKEYAVDRVFPKLGIRKRDYKWHKNKDGLSTGFHGIRMTATAWLKLGVLYLQNGMANKHDQLINQDWIDRTFTIGDEFADVPFGYLWWIEGDDVYCSKGLGGQRMCISTERYRAIVVASANYDQGLWEWLEGDDAAPQDQLVDTFFI